MTLEHEALDPVELAAIVMRAQAGEPSAIDRLLRHAAVCAQPYLRAFAGRRDDELRDLRQQVLLEVWRGISRLSDPGLFESWLARIVRNRSLDGLRRRYRHAEVLPTGGERNVDVAEHGDQSLEVARREVDRKVRQAIAELPPPYAEVLALRFLEGHSFDVVAKAVSKPNGTVRSICTRGKRMLRSKLSELT